MLLYSAQDRVEDASEYSLKYSLDIFVCDLACEKDTQVLASHDYSAELLRFLKAPVVASCDESGWDITCWNPEDSSICSKQLSFLEQTSQLSQTSESSSRTEGVYMI